VVGACASEEGLEAEAERLDLLELVDGERCDPGASARDADHQPFALEASQRVAHGREADVEPARDLLEGEPLPGRKLEAADLLAEDPIDAVLDGRDLERGGRLDHHR
jgi:hypothetical protein